MFQPAKSVGLANTIPITGHCVVRKSWVWRRRTAPSDKTRPLSPPSQSDSSPPIKPSHCDGISRIGGASDIYDCVDVSWFVNQFAGLRKLGQVKSLMFLPLLFLAGDNFPEAALASKFKTLDDIARETQGATLPAEIRLAKGEARTKLAFLCVSLLIFKAFR